MITHLEARLLKRGDTVQIADKYGELHNVTIVDIVNIKWGVIQFVCRFVGEYQNRYILELFDVLKWNNLYIIGKGDK